MTHERQRRHLSPRELRHAHGLSVTDMARMAGVSRADVEAFELVDEHDRGALLAAYAQLAAALAEEPAR